ncbi:MAG: tetraacyldisaccharide 4'-kinase [Planctomycetota bacterium]|nr:tetraacyldisaccharide 4'-kinase [Planctomycetota bacterium]
MSPDDHISRKQPGLDGPASPVPALPAMLARGLARLYKFGLDRRSARFDAGRGTVEFDRPVVSVGNLSVGGTGKTPMVARIIELLLESGRHPCIAMRGYKSSRATGGLSDEAEEYRRRFAQREWQPPIVAQPNRAEGLIELFGTEVGEKVDSIVLDDGFQHRQIARQLDIVLLDATRNPYADALVPAGFLRELPGALARADVVVITHAEAAPEAEVNRLRELVTRDHGCLLVGVARHRWSSLTVLNPAGDERPETVEWLRGKRVMALCAIGNPGAFERQVREACGPNAPSAGAILLGDHDPYEPATVARVLSQARERRAEVIVTTEKDWSKLVKVRPEVWPCPVARPRLEIAIEDEAALFRRLMECLDGHSRASE